MLWAAGTGRIEKAVSLAGVTDLARAARDGIGANAAIEFAGAEPRRTPIRCADSRDSVCSPTDRGRPRAVRLQRSFAQATGAELLELKGAGHFELIDPRTPEWARILDRRLGERKIEP